MKYQITCAHCDTRFLVDGKGGQTIECECPGCGGKMRVVLPKTDKGDGQPDDADYQVGYAPDESGEGNGVNGEGNGGDDGNNGHRRGLALGCLLFVVVIAAAIVAFMALNHSTKQPIDDPYENVEPDTTSMDSVVEDTVPEDVDTVVVHKEEPKVQAAPVDSTVESEAEPTDEGQVEAQPDAEASTESADKPSSSDHKAKDSGSKDKTKSSKDKGSKDKTAKDKTSNSDV